MASRLVALTASPARILVWLVNILFAMAVACFGSTTAFGESYRNLNEILKELTTKSALSSQSSKDNSIDLHIQFELNSKKLLANAKRQLDALAGAIGHEDLANFGFLIAGHTDASGDASHNKKLSESRANAVKTYLISRHHIAKERLKTTGWGEQRLKIPMRPNHPINRRVEVTAIPFSELK